MTANDRRRCSSCKRWVANNQLHTVFYAYDIVTDADVIVYGWSTAVRRVHQLRCKECANAARDARMRESERDHEVVLDRRHLYGWYPRPKVVTA